MDNQIPMRTLGQTDIQVTPVAMGCWPIAGMTSTGVNDGDSLATLEAAFEEGIRFFDTAYCYGADGQSERLIGKAFADCRDQVVIASKGGIAWNADGQRFNDASPATMRRHCIESLQRLGTDYLDLLYLHAPDPNVPVSESAGEMKRLMDEGLTRSVGVSNCNIQQLDEFAAVCRVSAVQVPYNMLQREIEDEILPWCQRHQASAFVYWPLMKGLLAGKMTRDHVFAENDGRKKYPMFHGEQWQRNQDFVDDLRVIAADAGRAVSDLVVNWTIHQPGVTAALCGAKRAYQIRQSAAAMHWKLTDKQNQQINQAIARRGAIAS